MNTLEEKEIQRIISVYRDLASEAFRKGNYILKEQYEKIMNIALDLEGAFLELSVLEEKNPTLQ